MLENKYTGSTPMTIVVYKASGLAGLTAISIILFYQAKYRNKIVKLINDFHEFDEEVKSRGWFK
jgi:hypothetical protein